LLRSALGVVAVTPLTVGVAHATPGTGTNVRPWVEAGSTVQFTGTPDSTNWRTTEPSSTVLTGRPMPSGSAGGSGTPDSTNWRATEPPSSIRLTGADRPQTGVPNGSEGRRGTPGGTRVGVPDRPTAGAPTRYTDLRSGQAARVVVRPGDSLWSI